MLIRPDMSIERPLFSLAPSQMEKYADIYTSRVSNFLRYTPYMYFRSSSQSTPHDTMNLTK